ncbi:MAG TPA: hypothetical protein VE987_21385, partial [Polyangiaceae bacterium]|nr:hypothetical protein [Polyangiaceae bacterium]
MKLRRLRLQMSAAPPVVAMMTSACTLRQVGPCSPAECLDHAAQPRATTTTLPPRSEALRRWQLPPDDPWAPFAKYTLLASLDESPRPAELPRFDALDDVQRARAAGERAGAAGLPPDTLWIVDMRGAASVAFGAALSQADATGSISLVPTFNNWPAADEMVPAEETLAALASASPAPPRERTGVTR